MIEPYLETSINHKPGTREPLLWDEAHMEESMALANNEGFNIHTHAPYPDELLPEDPVGSNERPEEVFMLQDQMNGYEYMDQWTSFVYLIKQKDLMDYVSGLDESPVTIIASMLYWTITECHPENRLPIVCGVCNLVVSPPISTVIPWILPAMSQPPSH